MNPGLRVIRKSWRGPRTITHWVQPALWPARGAKAMTSLPEFMVMNERSVFLAVLEIGDPAERAAYLDRACRRPSRPTGGRGSPGRARPVG